MTAIKQAGLDSFLRKPVPGIGAILIYGPDPNAVHDLAVNAVKKLAGSIDDPFNVVVLDEDAIGGDPGRLTDEVQSLSLMGGNRVVWVRGAGQQFQKSVEPILDGGVHGNLIVAEAGNIAKSSALSSRFTESKHAFILPLYEPSAEESWFLVEDGLKRFGLAIDGDAISLLIELAGRGSTTLLREVEKLADYCLGRERVSVADVAAISGNSLEVETDDLTDAVLSGRAEDVDRFFSKLETGGVDPGRMLTAAHGQVLRLIDCRLNVDRGMRAEQAVKAARPPVFFKRVPVMAAQLGLWNMADLLAASSTLAAAVSQARLNSAIGACLANRTLLSLARKARAMGQGRN